MKTNKLTKKILLNNGFKKNKNDDRLHLEIYPDYLNIAIHTDFSYAIYDSYENFLKGREITWEVIKSVDQLEALIYGLTGTKQELKI